MNLNKKTIYIACPHTADSEEKIRANVYKCMKAAEILWREGFIPFFTLLTYYYENEYFYHEYKEWIEYTSVWLTKCDIILRLPGESSDADDEVELAQKLNKKIYYDINELIKNEL